MAPELTNSVRWLTFLLLAVAAIAVEVAAGDGQPIGHSLATAAVWVVLAVIVGLFIKPPANPRAKPPAWVLAVLVALGFAPAVFEPLRRSLTGTGYPLELQMICGLRNVGLGLAACGGWLLCARLACVTSLFLMLFATTMTDHSAIPVLLGLYAAAGSVWLMMMDWSGLKAVMIASDQAVSLELDSQRVRLPWFGLGVMIVLLGLAGTVAAIGPRQALVTLGELMPTSGGSGDTDLFARSGVGDGPEEVAGENAQAAGMVETDRMIEDNKNSLIDAVNDMYGPPHKPPPDSQRMVSAGLAEVIENHGKLADNRRPSREFDTSRKGPKSGRPPTSQAARGVFEIEGRTPLHVRLIAYDTYEPATQRWTEARKPASRLIDAEGNDWMRPSQFQMSDWYAADERHRLKVANLKSNLVPTPTLLTRFRINKVDRADYFEWDYEGVLALAGRTRTPPGVVVTTDCHTLASSQLPESAFAPIRREQQPGRTLGQIPDSLRPELTRLAHQWASGHERGWPQIHAILTKLRTEYTLEPSIVPPPDHPAPVLWFLADSHAGPDYLFATAAALLLRTLDYPCRVCLGYYAAPAAYDPETAHTPVTTADLHMWPEVLLRDGHWLTIEPTPGFEQLQPRQPFWNRVLDLLWQMSQWARRNGVSLAGGLILCGVLAYFRRPISDRAAVFVWTRFPGRTWQQQVQGAIRLLERRGRWADRARPPGQTPAAWLRELNADRLEAFAQLSEWASYAPDGDTPWPNSAIRNQCREVVAHWSLHRWQELSRISSPGIAS